MGHEANVDMKQIRGSCLQWGQSFRAEASHDVVHETVRNRHFVHKPFRQHSRRHVILVLHVSDEIDAFILKVGKKRNGCSFRDFLEEHYR